jgi:hypothetical protein
MLFSKPYRFVLFFAYLISVNSETVRGVQQRQLSADEPPTVDLGTAGNFTILASAGISTVAPSSITGDIGVSPITATAMTGFELASADDGTASTSSQVTAGKAYGANYIVPTPARLGVVVLDMGIAYTAAAARVNCNATRINLGSGLIGGESLTPGIYTFGSGVTINSNVTIKGTATDTFIIQMTGNLMLAENTSVILEGGAKANNIFWQIAGNVKVKANAYMKGILLVKTDVLFQAGSTLNGRVLAQTACVLQKATISSEEPAAI